MSLNSKQSIRCPKCGQVNDITVWNSITVSDSADLKADLLAGKVNMFRCSACLHTALMPSPLLYNDEDKRLIITLSPTDDPLLKQQLFENVQNTSKDSGELEKLEGYNMRFVADYNDLLEKILIFDNDMNDKAIEVIKLMILMQEPEKAEQRNCRFGKVENGTIEFMVYDEKENQIYTSAVPMETYNTLWEQLRQSGVKNYSFNWEEVNSMYATKLLNGFNN